MKIVIEHGNTKRRIEGPFNICLSYRDAKHLADILNRVLAERVEGSEDCPKFGYGWIKVTPSDVQESIASTSPKPWDE